MIGFIGRLSYSYSLNSPHIELLLNDICRTNLSLISD
jgi:hypothetical protein